MDIVGGYRDVLRYCIMYEVYAPVLSKLLSVYGVRGEFRVSLFLVDFDFFLSMNAHIGKI